MNFFHIFNYILGTDLTISNVAVSMGKNLQELYLCFPQWSSPSEATESFVSKEIWLITPQFYEIRRLENFASLSDLHKFCLDHALEEVERWMPITLLTADGQIHLLPGKSVKHQCFC